MANIQTVFAPDPVLFGFTGLPGGAQLDKTAYPRQEVLFKILDGDVTISGVGDTQDIAITCDLPQNFAYALSEIFLEIHGDDVATWDVAALGILQDGTNVGRTMNLCFEGLGKNVMFNTSGSFGPLSRAYQFVSIPQVILVPTDAPSLKIKLGNDTTDQSAMNINFVARLLMFDISQAHSAQVNTPIPIR